VIIVPAMTQAAIVGDETDATHPGSVSVLIGPVSTSGAVGSVAQTTKSPVPKRVREQLNVSFATGASGTSAEVALEWKPQAANRTDPPQRADAAKDLTWTRDRGFA
jgi:hypothetical protein